MLTLTPHMMMIMLKFSTNNEFRTIDRLLKMEKTGNKSVNQFMRTLCKFTLETLMGVQGRISGRMGS